MTGQRTVWIEVVRKKAESIGIYVVLKYGIENSIRMHEWLSYFLSKLLQLVFVFADFKES